MPNRFGGFSDELETGIEKPAQATTTAVKQAGTQVAKQVGQQATAATKSIVDMLYGVSTPTGEEQSPDSVVAPPAATSQKAPVSPQGGLPGGDVSKKAPSDQDKIADVKQQLQQLHKQTYGEQFSLESEMRMIQAKKQQEAQQKIQEEEEEEDKQRKAQEQNSMSELEAPQGKQTGTPRQKKSSMILRRSQTKAEQNRGTTG